MKKIRLLPVLLISLLTLAGCRSESTVILSAPDEAGVFIVTGNGAAVIEVAPEDAGLLTAISGKSLEESLDELFSPEASASITREAWDGRERLLGLVAKETGAPDGVEVLTRHGDDIAGTELMKILDDLSGDFDDRALSKMLSRKGMTRKYSLGAVLSISSSWPETVDFVREWTRQISLKDNIRR